MAKPTLDGKLLFPSEYLAAEEFGGKDVTLTICDVMLDDLKMTDGSTERKPILLFERTNKKLVLNKTNATTIAKLHGGEARKWVGKQITLFPTECNAFGQMVDCIRVRSKIANKPGGETTGAQAAVPPSETPPGNPVGNLKLIKEILAKDALTREDYDAVMFWVQSEPTDDVLKAAARGDYREAINLMLELDRGANENPSPRE